jgi:hypothetical protein
VVETLFGESLLLLAGKLDPDLRVETFKWPMGNTRIRYATEETMVRTVKDQTWMFVSCMATHLVLPDLVWTALHWALLFLSKVDIIVVSVPVGLASKCALAARGQETFVWCSFYPRCVGLR